MAETAAVERWHRVSTLLDEALDLAPERRAAFVRAACGADEPLRAEVEEMLAACERPGSFMDRPAAEFAARLLTDPDGGGTRDAPVPELAVGARIGAYRVVGEVGRGGMGAVYLAERDDPQLRQRVAIKLVRHGVTSDYTLRRFVEERQILASLEHPGIARLLDGGVSAEGLPWFAMEYVEGVPLDRYCEAHGLAPEERLELFLQACDAVQYAHRNLVVHRDLKPSNLLVTAAGRPKLLDFGIARIVAPESAADAPPTALHLMTPEYASPEQLRGEAVTTATDVYSLGVLLYLLLTGRHPHRRVERPAFQVARAILDLDPALPSAVVAETPGAERLARRLRGDLDAIVLKAMRAEPDQRYGTVDELAADLRRHLRGLPVAARADTRRYRVRKFVRRNRASVAIAAAAAVLLAASSVVTAVQAHRVAAERDRARQVEGFLLGLFYGTSVHSASGQAVTVRELLDRGAGQVARGEVRQPEARARLLFALGRAYYTLGDYDHAIALLDSAHVQEARLRGADHPSTLSVANQLADVLRVAGRYDAAGEMYRRVDRARRREFGDRSTEVGRSLNGRGMVLRMQGRPREAEALLRQALAIDRERAAQEPAALTQTLNNLGHVLREQGRLAEAEALHRESLAARRTLWGGEHFEVSVSLANLAGVLRDRGDLAGADSLFRQVLALRARLAGEDHPDLATDRAGYALLLHRRGDAAGAEALYRRAVEVHRRVLPAGHPVTATTLLGLGDVLVAAGRPAEAEPLLREALTSRRAVLPADDWQVAEAESALGGCLSALGRAAEAEPLLLGSVAVLARRAGNGDPHTAAALRRLADHRARTRR